MPGANDSVNPSVGSNQIVEVFHLTIGVQKGMEDIGGGIGAADHLPGAVDRGAETVEASQRAQVRHLALAVEKGMMFASVGIGETRHLPRLVDAITGTVAPQGPQIRHPTVT